MKNLFCSIAISIVLLLIATQSYASWAVSEYSENRQYVSTMIKSDKNEEYFVIRFDTQNNCNANVVVISFSNMISKIDLYVKHDNKIIYQVDNKAIFKNDVWVEGKTGTNYVLFITEINSSFLYDLMMGNNVIVWLDDGNNIFSLKGSYRAINEATLNCINQKR